MPMVLLGVAGALLLLAVAAAWYAVHQRRQYLAFAAPPAMTAGQALADLAAGAPRVRCVLTGVAAAGPAGQMVSAVDATPCVWQRYEVWEHWMRSSLRSRRRWREWVEGETSTELFAVDDGTGRVLVDLGRAHLEGLRPAVDRITSPDRSEPHSVGEYEITGYQHTSWLIRPGDALTVMGAVVLRDGAVVLEGADTFPPIVTTGTREAFVRGARWRLLAGVAVGVLAAAGAVELVVWAAVAVTAS